MHRLLDWWGQGLRLALPLRWRQRWFPPPPGVWLRLDEADAFAWVGRRDDAAPAPSPAGGAPEAVLARHPDLPRWLLLPAGHAVHARVQLPQAAAGHLREALRYEIDRQTPFAADAVAWDARLLALDAVAGTAQTELVAVPLARLSPSLARAQALGIVLQGVDAADDEGRPTGVNLLPRELRSRPMSRWRQRNLTLAAIALLLVVAGAAGSLQRERHRATDIQASLQRERAEARRVAEQRQRLADLTDGARQIQAQRARRALLPVLLDALAERLPGNSHVERLSVQGERLQLSGIAPQSTRLVPALQGSPLWREVTMSGAVAADASRGGDRYTLDIRLAPAGGEAKP
ncbi:PilN domain-containing protein [Solilutibacter pythonis]|uniref:PilN domain-containing protein n=1 Tax=Solilutibacter pythonis TaxID=2483112 RepID=UPI00131451B3|nr:PilN domain-containing protein [Lysobacter pythonis]